MAGNEKAKMAKEIISSRILVTIIAKAKTKTF